MISHIDIAGINVELDDDIKKYIRRKVGKLDRYLPRHARDSAHAEVKLKQAANQRQGNKYECEVILHLPNDQVQVKESTMNMFAAMDIVEQKLKNRLVKYKQTHITHIKQKRLGFFKRLRSRFGTSEPEEPAS